MRGGRDCRCRQIHGVPCGGRDPRADPLCPQVRQLQEGAAQLRTVYAGEHAEAIASREQEVLQGWKELLAACEDARLHVSSTADALRFHSQARNLLSWMDGIAGQIGAADKPRYPWSLPPPGVPTALGSLPLSSDFQHANIQGALPNAIF